MLDLLIACKEIMSSWLLGLPGGSDDYEVWKPHNTLRSQEEQDVKGCLLGMREEFKRVKKDKW